MTPVLTVALLLVWPGAPAQTGGGSAIAPSLVRVFVHTDEDGEATELAARRQSVKDLGSAIASKKKSLALVDAEENADVVLTIDDRAVTVPKIVFGLGARPGQQPGGGGVVRVVVLHMTLAWSNRSTRFSNKNKPFENPRGWKSAADDIANQVEKWIAAHRADILQGRQ